VEAADDICYHIIDLEDAFHQNLVNLDEIIKYLSPIVEDDAAVAKVFKEEKEKVEYLRARAINRLMTHCVDVFIANTDKILEGIFENALLDCIPTVDAVKSLGQFEKERIYPSSEILQIEYAGFNVVGYILDEILLKTDYLENQESKKCRSLLGIFPCLMGIDMDVYTRIQRVTDWISGMSDSYAVSVYQRLNGSRLRGL
jgi:dGTPase